MNRASCIIVFITLVICCAILTTPAQAARKVILSTDIGHNADDAFALAMVLNSPELELDSVIVSSGPTSKHGKLTAKLLDILGRRDFPLIIGRYVWDTERENAKQFALSQDYFHSKPPVNDGAYAVARRIMASDGKITILAIAPLTDIADVLRVAPEVKSKIDEIILMGGSAYHNYSMQRVPTAEHNIRLDVESAREVFNSGVPIVMVGLDVTAMMQLSQENLKKIADCNDPAMKMMYQIYRGWGHGLPTMYDGVAVAVSFQRDLVKMEPMCVEVGDEGFTNIVKGGKPNAMVCTEVDKNRFMKLFMERIFPN